MAGIPQKSSVIGGSLSFQDTAAISAYDVSGAALGTYAYSVADDVVFKLTLSSASLSSAALAVAGVAGARWLALPRAQTEAVTTQVSDAATLSVAGLNSQADGGYELTGDIILSTAATLTMQPGGVSANQFGFTIDNGGTGSAQTGLYIYNTGTGRIISFRARVDSRTGYVRTVQTQAFARDSSTNAGIGAINGNFIWNDTTTTFTKIDLVASAGVISSGSWVRVRTIGDTY